ncbi:MAG: hypothetical protein HXS53_04915 [Theionarchaea archaeon]|nr:hypothetical protein [Theionarchaea archaeon]
MRSQLRELMRIQKAFKDTEIPDSEPFDYPGIDPTITYFDGKLRKGAIIFYGGDGCAWNTQTGGCFICPYSIAYEKIGYTQVNVRNQIEYLRGLESIKDLELLYLFPFSSFDEREVSKTNQQLLWEILSGLDALEYVVFESRPEYITPEILRGISEKLPDKKICVFMGLETSDDFVRKYCINKGFTFKTFHRKCQLLEEYSMYPCAFVLLKPPFITEKEAITDCVTTIHDCIDMVLNVIVMCANTSHLTIMELLSEMGMYRPPWLWSVVEVIEQLDIPQKRKVQLGGIYTSGKPKNLADYVQVNNCPAFYEYPHNCGTCDKEISEILADFNLNIFREFPSCSCRGEWEHELKTGHAHLRQRLPILYDRLIHYAASRTRGQ